MDRPRPQAIRRRTKDTRLTKSLRSAFTWDMAMSVRPKRFLQTGLICLLGFTTLAFIGNPAVPDVCTSQGYGFPLPIYIAWCGCFINNPQPSVNFAYVGLDVFTWGLLWLAASLILIKTSGRKRPSSI